MTPKVIDRFTVRDGLWEIDPRPYGLTAAKLYQYGGQDIPGKGGASHIFVKAKPGDMVRFNTSDGNNPNAFVVGESGWVNMNLWKSSAYWPPSPGPWCVSVNGIEVARGLGLPEGLHVSTFLIVEDVDSGSQPPSTPGGNYIEVVIRTFRDGLPVNEEVVWKSLGGSQ